MMMFHCTVLPQTLWILKSGIIFFYLYPWKVSYKPVETPKFSESVLSLLASFLPSHWKSPSSFCVYRTLPCIVNICVDGFLPRKLLAPQELVIHITFLLLCPVKTLNRCSEQISEFIVNFHKLNEHIEQILILYNF
jgi:hypothetical protein